MARSRSYPVVTREVFDRLKRRGRRDYAIAFEPPGGARGNAAGNTPLGPCTVEFAHDEAHAELRLTIVKKPLLLPEEVLWAGFERILASCREPDSA